MHPRRTRMHNCEEKLKATLQYGNCIAFGVLDKFTSPPHCIANSITGPILATKRLICVIEWRSKCMIRAGEQVLHRALKWSQNTICLLAKAASTRSVSDGSHSLNTAKYGHKAALFLSPALFHESLTSVGWRIAANQSQSVGVCFHQRRMSVPSDPASKSWSREVTRD